MRRVFTDADFDEMSFHDVRILGYAAMPDVFEIRFDVDYLVDWLCPPQRPGPISFQISPATLIFENPSHFGVSFKTPQGEFSINKLARSDFQQIPGAPLGTWQYEMSGHDDCLIRFRASGFRLHLRAEPTVSSQQSLSLKDRGGISFDTPG